MTIVIYDPRFPFAAQDGKRFERRPLRTLYSCEDIRALCEEFDIKGYRQSAALIRFLRDAASIYNYYAEQEDFLSDTRHASGELKCFAAAAQKLSERIDTLSPETLTELRRGWQMFGYQESMKRLAEAGGRDNPVDDSALITNAAFSEAVLFVHAFAKAAQFTAEKALKSERGKPPVPFSLKMWVSNAAAFWTEKLGRKFTLSWEKQYGSSPTVRFCAAAFEPLRGPHAPTLLNTALKEHRKHFPGK